MPIYLLANGAMQTTTAFTKVTTGTSIKTLMQLKLLQPACILEWGISFDGSSATTPGLVELIETDVAATVTAYVKADITKIDYTALQISDPTVSFISVGTSASGYTGTVEGTITSVRNLDAPQLIAPTNNFYKRYQTKKPYIQANKFARIRCTFSAAINTYCYIILEF